MADQSFKPLLPSTSTVGVMDLPPDPMPVDYGALAAKFGGTVVPPPEERPAPIDYGALAAKFGGQVVRTPPIEVPEARQFTSDVRVTPPGTLDDRQFTSDVRVGPTTLADLMDVAPPPPPPKLPVPRPIQAIPPPTDIEETQPARIPTTISPEGLATLKDREGGFYATPYQDSGTGLAIGYGMHTWQGKPVTKDLRITEEQADAELARQVARERVPMIRDTLQVPITQPQFDALVSVAWNHPETARRIVAKLNEGEPVTPKDFQWSATVKGQPNVGLAQRRGGEYAQFNQPPPPSGGTIAPLPAPATTEPPVTPDQWDRRPDGSTKGLGFLGLFKVPGTPDVASEYSIADSEQLKDAKGNYLDYPTLVPTLTHDEVLQVLEAAKTHQPVPPAVAQKAEAFALQRRAAGKPLFATEGEQQNLYPDIARAPVAAPPPAPAAAPAKPTFWQRLAGVGDPEVAYGEIAGASPLNPARIVPQGVQQVGRGLANLPHPSASTEDWPHVVHASTPAESEQSFNALADVLEGSAKAMSPAVVVGALPTTAATLGATWLASSATEKAAAYANATPGQQRFYSALAGTATALVGSGRVIDALRTAASTTARLVPQAAVEAASSATRAAVLSAQLAGKPFAEAGPGVARAVSPGYHAPIEVLDVGPSGGSPPTSGMTETFADVVRTALAPEPPALQVGQGRDRMVPTTPDVAAPAVAPVVPPVTPTAPASIDEHIATLAAASRQPGGLQSSPEGMAAFQALRAAGLSPTDISQQLTVYRGGGPDATQVGQQPQGDLGEHPPGGGGGQTAAPGGGDRAVEQPPAPVTVPQEVAPPPSVTYFRSGIASAPADFDGFAKAGVPIGITARNIAPEITDRAIDYVKNGGQLFVDSGAIKELTSGGQEVPNFDKVLGYYTHLADHVGPERAQGLYVVAPDKVGDPVVTQERQTQYAPQIRDLMARGVNVILPVQKSDTVSLADQMVWAQNHVLAGKVGNDVIWGIPFGKKVYSAEEVAEGLKAFQANMPADAPLKIHLLGMGERNQKFQQSIDTIRAAVPNVEIHADSSRAQAMFGAGRPTQSRYDQLRQEFKYRYFHGEKRHASEAVLFDALASADLSPFSKDEIAQIAHAARVKPFALQRATESPEAWQAFLEAWEAAAAPSHAGMTDAQYQDNPGEIVEKIALARAHTLAGPAARRAAITENEAPPAPLVPTDTERTTLQAASDNDLALLAARGNVRNRELAAAEIARRKQGAPTSAPVPTTAPPAAATGLKGWSDEDLATVAQSPDPRFRQEATAEIARRRQAKPVTFEVKTITGEKRPDVTLPPATPAAPVVTPPPTKPPPASTAPAEWTEIGKNHIGQTLYENQRGVRSYIENGVRQVESVRMVPTRAGIKAEIPERTAQWTVVALHPSHPGAAHAAAEARGSAALTDAEWVRLDALMERERRGDEMDEADTVDLIELQDRVAAAMGEGEEEEPEGEAPSVDDFAHMAPDDIFPAPEKTVLAKDLVGSEMLTTEQAAARLKEWKAEATRIGRTEDHSREVVLSLFDRTGRWSQPYVDAGYDVHRIDVERGHDIIKYFPTRLIANLRAEGKTIVGVLAAPPCTSFAVSGARWWKDQHDKEDEQLVEKKYGYFAARYFDTPLDYANTLVETVQAIIEFANPTQFHAMENPIGRIATQNDLPKPLLVFDPSNFGDPYTKKTLLWGAFNPNLPTANVNPSKGSLVHVLRGDDPEEKLLRSVTPEGFAYAFFMANHQAAVATVAPAAKPTEAPAPAGTAEELGPVDERTDDEYAIDAIRETIARVEREDVGKRVPGHAKKLARLKAELAALEAKAATPAPAAPAPTAPTPRDPAAVREETYQEAIRSLKTNGVAYGPRGLKVRIVPRADYLYEIEITEKGQRRFEGKLTLEDAPEYAAERLADLAVNPTKAPVTPQLPGQQPAGTVGEAPTSEQQPTAPTGERGVAGGGQTRPGDTAGPVGGDGTPRPEGVAGEQPADQPDVSPEPARQARRRKRREGGGVPGSSDVTRLPGEGDVTGGGGGAVDASHVDTAELADTQDEADAHAKGEAQRWFTITDTGTLTEGGWVSKLADNLAALRLLKQLEREKRPASDAEQAVLARYVGWGATELSKVVNLLDSPHLRDPHQVQARQELEGLLTKAELKELGESTANAHYSFVDLPRAIWALVEQLGFTGGSILEPAIGTGHFLGTMPGHIRTHRKTRVYGVDKEPIAAKIAQQLYQGAYIQAAPLQEAVLPENYFDLIVSNVPFGRIRIFDPAFVSPERTPMTKSVHNYYFGKELDLARPGGLIINVTSRQTLDSRGDAHRRYLHKYAKFLGAFRLPDQAFQKTAGTAVVTDVLVFQKRGEGAAGVEQPFLESQERKDLGSAYDEDSGTDRYESTNEYYKGRAAHILGKEARSGKMNRRGDEYNVEGKVTPEQLAAAVARLPKNVYTPSKAPPRKVATTAQKDTKQGSYVLQGGKLYTYDKGTLTPSELTGQKLARAKSYVPLRDAYLQVLEAMMTHASDADLATAQATLQRQYDAYKKAHGSLNDPTYKPVLQADPNAPRVLGLELVEYIKPPKGAKDRRTEVRVTGLADVFTKRLMRPVAEPTTAASPIDALVQSVRWKGGVDLPFMETLAGQPAVALTAALSDEMFEDPATQTWVTRDEYLSGDVVTKLQQAAAAANASPRYAGNVTALTAVQPTRLTIDDFTVGESAGIARKAPFGATWVPVALIQRFLNETGGRVTVRLLNTGSKVKWYVEGDGRSEYLSPHYDYAQWAEEALNGEVPTIWVKHDDGSRTIDVKETELYRQSLGQLRESWDSWWKSDVDATDQILEIYNAMFHRNVARTFDGDRLVLPNMNPEIVLRDPQKTSIVGAIHRGNTMLAQLPGWGKTFEMIAIAGEWKRLGLANKPMIVVPNHLVDQWRRDFVKFYPAARVLLPEKRDFESAANRRAFVSRVANNDWDAVVIGMSQFLRLGVKLETVKAFVAEQEDQLLAEGAAELGVTTEEFSDTVDAYGEGDKDARRAIGGRGVPRSVKDLARAILNLRARLQRRADQQGSDPINFEELGIDGLMVDEAHMFKNLYFYSSKNNIVGLKGSDADQAVDMFLKVRHINQTSNNRNLIFATGTPITNTMSEIYTVFRYLAQAQLDRLGMSGFDSWANAYAVATGTMEPRPEGGYKERTRLSDWANLQELSAMFHQFADVATMDDVVAENARLAALGRPPLLKLPKAHKVVVELEPHPESDTFYQNLRARIEALKSGKVNPKDDNHLKITSEASLAAIDMRLVMPHAVDDPGGRLRAVAREVDQRYRASHAVKGTQLIFLDVGVPKGDDIPPLPASLGGKAMGDRPDEEETDPNITTAAEAEAEAEAEMEAIRGLGTGKNLYAEIKRLLVARGIPADEIVFMHSVTPADQGRVYQAMREGRIRVLISTRAKGATGMNVQDRGVAIHHVDVPWRPDQLEQADARFVRDGNTMPDVDIVRYVTKKSFDEYRWHQLAKKQGFITAFYKGTLGSMQDIDLSQVDMQVASAIASGDPRTLEMVNTERQLAGLRARSDNYKRRRMQAERDLQRATERTRRLEEELAAARDVDTAIKAWAEAPTVVLDKKIGRYQGLDDATPQTFNFKDTEGRKGLKAALEPLMSSATYVRAPIGHAGPFVIWRDSVSHAPVHTILSTSETKVTPGYEAPVLVVKVPLRRASLGERSDDQLVGTTPEWTKEAPPDLVRSLDSKLSPTWAEHFIESAARRLKETQQEIASAQTILTKRFEQADELQGKEARLKELRQELGIERATPAAAPTPMTDEGWTTVDTVKAGGPADEEAAHGGFAENVPRMTGTRAGTPAAPGTPATPSTTVYPIEFPELVELARELIKHAPKVVRGFRGDPKAGTFASGTGLIRLHAGLFKAGQEQQLAKTLAHEMGHLVDWLPHRSLKRGNLLGHLFSLRSFLKHRFTAPDGTTIKNPLIAKELGDLSDKWRPWNPAAVTASFAAYRRSAKERYADAISVLLNSPGLLQQDAPVFYKQFFAALTQKPEVKAAYEALQALAARSSADMMAHRLAGDRAMVQRADVEATRLEREKQRQIRGKASDLWLRLRQQLVDKNAPVIARIRALQQRGIRINPDNDPRYLLEERNYLGGKLKGFTEDKFEPIYKAITEAGIDWTTFGQMLLYERVAAGDRAELANPRGIGPKDAAARADAVRAGLTPAQQTVLADSLTAFRKAVAGVMDEAHAVGLYTDKLHTQMRANPAYATFRNVDYLDRAMSARVYQQIGMLGEIQNPADATMQKTLAIVRAIEQQKMKLAVFDLLEQHFPTDIKQARETADQKRMVLPSRVKGEELITYYEKGRLRGKYVDPFIAHSLDNTAVGHDWAVVTVLRFLNSKVFRPIFTTFNPGFQTFNFGRDLLRFWKNMPAMSLLQVLPAYWRAAPLAAARAFGTPTQATPAQLQARTDLIAAERSALFSITFNDLNAGRHVEDTVIEDTLSQLGIGGYSTARHPRWQREIRAILDFFERTGNFIETLPKAAAIYEFQRRTGVQTVGDLPPDVRSFIRRMVGSPDFLAGGTLKPVTNEIFLFSNAIAQALRSDIEVAFSPSTERLLGSGAGGAGGQPPPPPPPPTAGGAAPPVPPGPPQPSTRSGFWWKTAKLNLAPKLLSFAVLYLLATTKDENNWRNRLQRLFRGVSEYDLTNYLVIPIGYDTQGNVVYIRLPQDDFGRLISGLLWKALRLGAGDKDVWDTATQVLDYMAGQTPTVTPSLGALGDVKDLASGRNVYNAYRNRMLFTDDEFEAFKGGDLHQVQKFIGYEFNQLGASIVYRFSAGEQRPRERTTGQKILDLPIVSNIAGRWIKITNLGELEKLRGAAEPVKREEAISRVAERRGVDDALWQLQALPPEQRTPERRQALARAVVLALHPNAAKILDTVNVPAAAQGDPDVPLAPGEGAKIGRQFVDVYKKINMGITRGIGDALTDAVLSATSTDQKVAILTEAAKGMGETELQTWLRRAGQNRVISGPVYGAFIRSHRAAQEPAAVAR